MVAVKRAYDPVNHVDGTRFLVERLWPRGISKTALHLEAWLKNVAPSTELRQWFHHDPKKWGEFRRRYRRELDAHPEAWQPIMTATRRGPVSLICSARDTMYNNAVALQAYLEAKLRRQAPRAAADRRRRG